MAMFDVYNSDKCVLREHIIEEIEYLSEICKEQGYDVKSIYAERKFLTVELSFRIPEEQIAIVNLSRSLLGVFDWESGAFTADVSRNEHTPLVEKCSFRRNTVPESYAEASTSIGLIPHSPNDCETCDAKWERQQDRLAAKASSLGG